MGLPVSLWGAAYSLGNILGYLGIPIGPLWSRTQLYVTKSWYWKLHMVTRNPNGDCVSLIIWRLHHDCLYIF